MQSIRPAVLAVAALSWAATSVTAQQPEHNTFLAVGAHAGDMELTAGAVLLHQRKLGDRVVLLHLTLGEGGNPRLNAESYARQKRREAEAAAQKMGAEVLFAPYRDGELPDDEEVRRYVAEVIRRVKPTHIITHWKNSIHKDHARAHDITVDAVLLASLESVITDSPRHRGVRGIYFAENWEDAERFSPYVYVAVDEDPADWREVVTQYEFVRGNISSFAYLDYYDALMRVRGAEARKPRAVAFDIDPLGKRGCWTGSTEGKAG